MTPVHVCAGFSGSEPLKAPLFRAQWRTRTILATSIRVMNASLGWPAQGNGHVQGADRQALLHAIADGPADHPARMQIENDRQIDPAFARPDMGDVARPFLVGMARSEVLLQKVRRDVERMVAVRTSSGK